MDLRVTGVLAAVLFNVCFHSQELLVSAAGTGVNAAAGISAHLNVANGDPSSQLSRLIDPILSELAEKYNCSISVALRGPSLGRLSSVVPLSVSSVAGVADRTSGRRARTGDRFVWGSVTKVVTGAAVLQLVDSAQLRLDDFVAPLVDPFIRKSAERDPHQNFTCMADLWGPEANKITVRHLLGMRSGIPDYDTASPSGSAPSDLLRAESYKNPASCFSPSQLLGLPWVRTKKLMFPPGECDRKKYFNCYSSTNFVLLGMLLAERAGETAWELYRQSEALTKIAADFGKPGPEFAVKGSPSEYTLVKGYDTTRYNNNTGSIDVSHVCGVFGGWTAADVVMDAADAAALGQDLYGPSHKLVSKLLVDEMYASSAFTGYGLATFNLSRLTPDDVAYGHLGATYGYQSILAFAPGINTSIAVATNIERDFQDQPQDVFCHVYNMAKAILLAQPVPHCTFTPGYWDAGCRCTTKADGEIVLV